MCPSSLRAQAIWLVLVIVIPFASVTIADAVEDYQMHQENVRQEALQLARSVALDQEYYIESTRQLLLMLAQLPEVRTRDAGQCMLRFTQLHERNPLYAGFFAADPDATVFCPILSSSLQDTDKQERQLLLRAIRTGTFVLGDYIPGPSGDTAYLPCAYPLVESDGTVLGAVGAKLTLNWLHQRREGLSMVAGTSISIVDEQGTILAYSSEATTSLGWTMLATHVRQSLLQQETGVTLSSDGTGQTHFVGFTPVSKQIDRVYVVVSIPADAALAHIRAHLIWNLLLLVILAVLAVTVACVVSSRFFIEPLNGMVRVTRKLAAGDLAARTGMRYSYGEIGYLAQAVDQMAEALQNRDTEARHAKEQLHHHALHDALTGLPNRLLFLELLGHAMKRVQRVEGQLFAVLFLDLDDFKLINDSLGHPDGDMLLISTARRLERCLRTSDIVARLGGDEFAILLDEMDSPEDATALAERIQQVLALPYHIISMGKMW